MWIYLICIIIVLCLIRLSIYLNKKINLEKRKSIIVNLKKVSEDLQDNQYSDKPSNINEESYQRFYKFFDSIELTDPNFKEKMSKIYYLITKEGMTNLDEIAEQTGCTYDELLLKIKYLKNKRKIGNLFVDRHDHVIRQCTKEDEDLLNKYSKYIYEEHLQPSEIAHKLMLSESERLDVLEKKVIDDLSYLDDKYLINGLNVDTANNKIIYYTLEKHKSDEDYLSIKCPQCGALNDVPRKGKVECKYCKGKGYK